MRVSLVVSLALLEWQANALCVPAYGEGRYLVNISVDGKERPLVLDVPSFARRHGDKTGVSNGGMIGFHGWHSNPWYFDKLSNATNLTRHYGMVLALPFGTAPKPTYYCCPESVSVEECSSGNYLADDLTRACGWKNSDESGVNLRHVDDVAYTKAIARLMVNDLCVEEDKIFAFGLSAGGSMAARVACEAADVLAGVATMSGGLALDNCDPAKPIAYLEFCGTLDSSCNATSTETFRLWARIDGCSALESRRTYESATTRCRVAAGCAGTAFSEQCLIAGLGDDIPGHDRSAPIVPNTTLVLQAASNIDSVKYSFDRFSALFPSADWADEL